MRRALPQRPAVGGVHIAGRSPAGLPRPAVRCSGVGCRRFLYAVDPGLLVLGLLLLAHTELPIESMIVP